MTAPSANGKDAAAAYGPKQTRRAKLRLFAQLKPLGCCRKPNGVFEADRNYLASKQQGSCNGPTHHPYTIQMDGGTVDTT